MSGRRLWKRRGSANREKSHQYEELTLAVEACRRCRGMRMSVHQRTHPRASAAGSRDPAAFPGKVAHPPSEQRLRNRVDTGPVRQAGPMMRAIKVHERTPARSANTDSLNSARYRTTHPYGTGCSLKEAAIEAAMHAGTIGERHPLEAPPCTYLQRRKIPG
jgi:hypothetical protein